MLPSANRRGPPLRHHPLRQPRPLTNRSTYKALITIFGQQCELSGDTVVVKTKTGGDCEQDPSDPDATYDGHTGPGSQVPIAETCVPGNDVQLITAAPTQTACTSDAQAVRGPDRGSSRPTAA